MAAVHWKLKSRIIWAFSYYFELGLNCIEFSFLLHCGVLQSKALKVISPLLIVTNTALWAKPLTRERDARSIFETTGICWINFVLCIDFRSCLVSPDWFTLLHWALALGYICVGGCQGGRQLLRLGSRCKGLWVSAALSHWQLSSQLSCCPRGCEWKRSIFFTASLFHGPLWYVFTTEPLL